MKSFATSICPIKKPLAVNMRHPRAIPVPSPRHLRPIPAWRTIPQPISKRFLSGVITGLRHGNPAQKDTRVIPAPSLRHPRAIPASSPHHPRTIPVPSQRYPRIIPAWQVGLLPNVGRFGAFFMDIEVLIGCSSRSSARRPCLQVLHSHLRVAKRSSDRSLTRRPCPQVLLWQGRVPKGRKSVPLTVLR